LFAVDFVEFLDEQVHPVFQQPSGVIRIGAERCPLDVSKK
jgi:hypothetical protein